MADRSALKWRIATLLDKLPGQCWADLCFWTFGDRPGPWSPMTSTCREDFERCGACYCGKLRRPDLDAAAVGPDDRKETAA